MTTIEDQHIFPLVQILATARTRQELFSQFFEKIKPLILLDDVGLIVLNKAGTHWKDWAVTDNYHRTEDKTDLKEAGLDGYQAIDSLIAVSLRNTGIIGKEEITEKHPDLAFYDTVILSPIEDYMYTPLIVGEHTIGALWLDAYQKQTYTEVYFPLFENLAALVAIAVANIQANEEILKKEQEKTLLLSISQAIAEIDNMVDLLQSIDRLLLPIFNHDDAGVSVADQDKAYITDYHALYADIIPASPEARRLNTTAQERGLVKMPLAGSLLEWGMKQPPMMGKLADLAETGLEAPFLDYELEGGLTDYFCAPFTVSGNTFGLFNLLFKGTADASQLSLFAQVTDIIAVALSNILAHEEIQKRKDEEALKVALIDSLNQGSNWEEKLFGVTKALSKHFPFHLISFGMIHPSAENHHYSFEQVGFDECRVLDFPAFLEMIRMDEKAYLREIGKRPYQAVTIQEGEAFLEAAQHHLVQHAVHRVFGIQSMMVIPLTLKNGCLLYTCLYSKQTTAFNSSHHHLFRESTALFHPGLGKTVELR